MLKRLWLAGSACWALLALLAGVNRGDGSGVHIEDLKLAALPFVAGAFLWLAGRWIFTGSLRRRRVSKLTYRS